MTWGSSHAQLPRAARPRWCQRGWPPRRGSWSCQRKSERHGEVLPQPPTHHTFTLSPHLLRPSPPCAGDKAKPSVQDESSKRLGLWGTRSILIKMSSAPQGWCQSLFGLGRCGTFVFHFVCHEDRTCAVSGWCHLSFLGVREQTLSEVKINQVMQFH